MLRQVQASIIFKLLKIKCAWTFDQQYKINQKKHFKVKAIFNQICSQSFVQHCSVATSFVGKRCLTERWGATEWHWFQVENLLISLFYKQSHWSWLKAQLTFHNIFFLKFLNYFVENWLLRLTYIPCEIVFKIVKYLESLCHDLKKVQKYR